MPAWSQYAAMRHDEAVCGPAGGDGVLQRQDLETRIEHLKVQVAGLGQGRALTDVQQDQLATSQKDLREATELLQDMYEANVDGLVYLPEEFLTQFVQAGPDELVDIDHDVDLAAVTGQIPDNLRRRASELLMLDDQHRFGRITADVIRSATARYEAMDARINVGMVRSKEEALKEISQLAQIMGLHHEGH